MFYDRQGNVITLEEWVTGLTSDRRVAETTLPDGKCVSTVWLGLDHALSGPRLHIFETMVFPSESQWNDLDVERYSTEAEALEGHDRMVAKWSAQELTGEGVDHVQR